jgi:Mg2+/Co2+ transporter CorB
LLISGLIVLICLLFSAFFSAAETAITAVSRARLYNLIEQGNRRATIVGELRKKKDQLIGSILLGNNMVNIFASAIATSFAIGEFGGDGIAIATVAMTFFVVIFGEVLPKTYAIMHAEKTSLALSPALQWIFRLLYPFSFAMKKLIDGILKLFGINMDTGSSMSSASEVIRGTIELHHDEGHVVKHDRDMLGTILDLDEISVGEIMIHRLAMEMIDAGQPVEAIISDVISSTHSRIPLWKDEPDNIVGILHVKSLLREVRANKQLNHDDIMAITNKPWFVPETTSLKEQLHAFRRERQHFAIVVDEYGDIKGMVTLEDIIEEIVGNIDDEHDRIQPIELIPAGENAYMFDGSMTIRDVNRLLEWDLPDEDASTVAGLILHEAREIPESGASFVFHGMKFDIVRRRGNQITRVRIEKLEDEADRSNAEA